MQLLDITAEQYHAHPAVSSGMVRCMHSEGPPMCEAKYVKRSIVKEPTAEMVVGSALHAMMEGDEQFDASFVVLPEDVPSDRRTKGFKEWIARNCDGRQILSWVDYHRVYRMRDAIIENPATMECWECRQREVPCLDIDPVTKLEIKALCDVLQGDIVWDYKTTRTRTRDEFRREILNRGYHIQAAHYLAVTGCREFRIVAVPNEPPHEAMVYVMDDDLREWGRSAWSAAMAEIRWCKEFATWHSPGWGDITTIHGRREYVQ